MKNKFVVGHKNPDTDSVVSAIMLSWLLNEQGNEYTPGIAGEINKETEFVLSSFNYQKPEIITEERNEDSEFFLVDHNELTQSIAKPENIIGIIDHHLIGGLKTSVPIYFRAEPVGSTSTLVYKLIKENSLVIDEKQAGLLLAGIISDTLNLTSPTTTTEDIDSLYELKEISKIDTEELSKKMFDAKSDFSDKSIEDIITGDMKEYDFNKKKVVIGVAETTSLSYFKENEKELVESLKQIKEKEKYDFLFFAIVDIINKNAYLYGGEEEQDIAKEVFKGERAGEYTLLKGVSSRKKEIAPPLSDYYNKQ